MTVTFDLPRSFDVSEFLTTPRLQHSADAARWLVSTILRKTANRDTDPWGLVRLDSSILRRIMGRHSSDVIRALEQGAIETAPYCVGVRCKGYRLAKRYLGDRSVRWPAVDPALIDRLEQERQRQDTEDRHSLWLPIHYALDAEQRRLTIDPAANEILENLPDHCRLCQDVLVGNIRRRDLRQSVSATGRVFNSITGLKRELRTALRIDGESVGGVDIACAQPALLALDMTQVTPTNGLKGRTTYKHTASLCLPSQGAVAAVPPLPASSGLFASLVFGGRLYELLMQATGLDRDRVKLGFLRDVLAKRGRYPSPVENAFRVAFPIVYEYIRAVNRLDHAELIRRLQRLEAWLVVEQVAPRLIGRAPCITLHDAIYSTQRSLPTVEEAFQDTFDAIGCRLKLKREAALTCLPNRMEPAEIAPAVTAGRDYGDSFEMPTRRREWYDDDGRSQTGRNASPVNGQAAA
jgi:hypothetical protein